MKHTCSEPECIYFGQPTSPNQCRCHKPETQMLTAEVERLRAVLSEIADRHVPDQPMAIDIPEADYIRRQHTELRRMAREALAR